VEITIDSRSLEADLRDFPARSGKAMVRALNRGINSARTLGVREIARDTGLKSKDVRDAFKVREASLSRPEARLGTSLKRIPLIKFQARGPEPSRGKGRGVTYRGRNGRERIGGGFIATVGAGHRGVFVRKGKGRLPIREAFGPSLGRVFAKFRPAMLAKARETFEKNFVHELKYARELAGGDSASTN
jgi:hypothetical protein